jgi:hypothetical protein
MTTVTGRTDLKKASAKEVRGTRTKSGWIRSRKKEPSAKAQRRSLRKGSRPPKRGRIEKKQSRSRNIEETTSIRKDGTDKTAIAERKNKR